MGATPDLRQATSKCREKPPQDPGSPRAAVVGFARQTKAINCLGLKKSPTFAKNETFFLVSFSK